MVVRTLTQTISRNEQQSTKCLWLTDSASDCVSHNLEELSRGSKVRSVEKPNTPLM